MSETLRTQVLAEAQRHFVPAPGASLARRGAREEVAT